MLKKHKAKTLNERVLSAYATIANDLELLLAELRYIAAWQALPDYGVTYFRVKVRGSRFKEELLGV